MKHGAGFRSDTCLQDPPMLDAPGGRKRTEDGPLCSADPTRIRTGSENNAAMVAQLVAGAIAGGQPKSLPRIEVRTLCSRICEHVGHGDGRSFRRAACERPSLRLI
jgi:hypothetical protein